MAKLIRTLSTQDHEPLDYITNKKEITNSGIPLIAIPTTSGSGSEATHFAVVYVGGVKYSIAHRFMLPEHYIVDPQFTMSLPPRITATTGMDVLAQAIESFWSIHSNEESKGYSSQAIRLTLESLADAVNKPSKESRLKMAKAAHLAGKAINITKTTAPHALSYTLTSRFGIPHGHAVALTLGPIFLYNTQVSDADCNDKRGALYVSETMKNLCSLLGCSRSGEATAAIHNLMKEVGLETKFQGLGFLERDLTTVVDNVNHERLANNPRMLTKNILKKLLVV